MITDFREVSDAKTFESDICVVGAGIAGLSFALEFAGTGLSVTVLESGGMEPARELQELNKGKNVGFPYYELDRARIRAFGGTGHRWHGKLEGNREGVRLRGLDRVDFEKRDWVPYSGWPFGKEHLDPYYERAHEFFGIGEYQYDPESWRSSCDEYLFPFEPGVVDTTVFQFADKTFVLESCADRARRARNVQVFTYATVLNIETDDRASCVTGLSVSGLHGKHGLFRAKHYILAQGGLETPRLMLISNNVTKNGIGNDNDLVGRFFMEHPHLWSGMIVPYEKDVFDRLQLYRIHRANHCDVMGKFRLSEEHVRTNRLLGYSVSIHPGSIGDAPKAYKELEKLIRALIKGKFGDRGALVRLRSLMRENSVDIPKYGLRKLRAKVDGRYREEIRKPTFLILNHMSEQAPNPESRVMLDDRLDSLGQRRIKLDWRLSEIDIQTIIGGQQAIKEQLEVCGIGTLKIEMDGDSPPPDIHGGWHHMGTTRMHPSPRLGVVDQNCRVHGMENLYIAGSSVFPTVGYANPSLTAVALSIRLADCIKRKGQPVRMVALSIVMVGFHMVIGSLF